MSQQNLPQLLLRSATFADKSYSTSTGATTRNTRGTRQLGHRKHLRHAEANLHRPRHPSVPEEGQLFDEKGAHLFSGNDDHPYHKQPIEPSTLNVVNQTPCLSRHPACKPSRLHAIKQPSHKTTSISVHSHLSDSSSQTWDPQKISTGAQSPAKYFRHSQLSEVARVAIHVPMAHSRVA